jgi:hypothetical protein
VKGKYTDKPVNCTTSTEVRFALGVIFQFGIPGWQNELPESPDLPPSRQNAARCSAIENQSVNQKRATKTRTRKERKKKSEAENHSRARAGPDRKREDEYYFAKQQDAASGYTREEQTQI